VSRAKLVARWDKRSNDILYLYPDKRDGALLHWLFSSEVTDEIRGLFQELKSRGYDLTTFHFEIRKKEKL
jgi:hypothetical protein